MLNVHVSLKYEIIFDIIHSKKPTRIKVISLHTLIQLKKALTQHTAVNININKKTNNTVNLVNNCVPVNTKIPQSVSSLHIRFFSL